MLLIMDVVSCGSKCFCNMKSSHHIVDYLISKAEIGTLCLIYCQRALKEPNLSFFRQKWLKRLKILKQTTS